MQVALAILSVIAAAIGLGIIVFGLPLDIHNKK